MITVQMKLTPTAEQEQLLIDTTSEYITSVNELIDYCIGQVEPVKLSSASFRANLPSAVRNEVVNVVKSILKKHRNGKTSSLPILRKPVCTWNNQNYRIKGERIEFPVMVSGRSERISVSAAFSEYQYSRLSGKLGTLRITRKNGKWIAQIAVDTPQNESVLCTTDTSVMYTTDNVVCTDTSAMGVDIGLKIPAVAVTDKGKTKFFGNGRRNKYMKRRFRSKRRKLGKAKKSRAIKQLSNKEQRWMRDQDHKTSRAIVNFAIENHVTLIRMEQLTNIRSTARTSRKNERNLHTWSFYRLSQYIEYKANLAGIRVEYVDPKYTSQTCPKCGERNHAHDRRYICSCGYHSHRDRVGAMNIIHAQTACRAPEVVGNRQSA